MRNPLPWNRVIVFLATVAAIVLTNVFFWGQERTLYHDARGYYELSKIVGENGLFHFSDDHHTMDPEYSRLFAVRTYGYPLFVALCSLLTDHDELVVQITVFNAQLLIYILICYFAAKCSQTVFRASSFSTWLYACTVLNPFLLIYTTQLLTDLLSAVTIYLLLALLLKTGWDKLGDERPTERARMILAASFLASFSVMLRPANISIIIALLLIFSRGAARTKGLSLAELVVLCLGLSIPVVPQLANNYRSFQKIQPLVVAGLGRVQLNFGAQFLKYGTVVRDDERPQLNYHNPFIPPGSTKLSEFLRQRPLGYALTLSVHAFALLDQDFPFPYIHDLHPWYRWPLSVLNYIFLAGVMYGMLIAIRRLMRKKRMDREAFGIRVIGTMSISYFVLYLPCDAENRFSLPLLLLWSPFFVIGLSRLRLLLACRCYGATARVALGLAVFVGCCIWFSSWIQWQAPRLRQAADSSESSCYAGILSPRRTATADPSAANAEVGG